MVPFDSSITMSSLFTEATRRHGRRVAVIDGSRQISYAELGERSNRLANAMIGLGIEKGQRIGIMSTNRLEYFEIDFAIAKAGLTRVPLYTRNAPKEHRHFLEQSEPRLVFVEEKLVPALFDATDGNPLSFVDHVIVIGASDEGTEYEEFLASGSAAHPSVPVFGEDPYQIRFTAGSTGLPKGALGSHRSTVTAHMGNLYALSMDSGMSADDPVLHISPFSHQAGFMMAGPSWLGCTHVILGDWEPEKFFKVVERHRVSTTLLVPTMISLLLEDESLAPRYDTSSLRSMSYAAAPITPTLLSRALKQFGPVLKQGWGLTESPSFDTFLPARDHSLDRPEMLESCGLPLPWVDLRIVDEDGNTLPDGEIGEVAVRGAQVMDGYINHPEATRKAFRGDWLMTGDVGVADEQGYIYLRDRKGFVIISGGFNIWPAEVESALATHPDVIESSVVGLPDEKWGEIVGALVRVRAGSTATGDEISEHCLGKVASYKRPRKVLVISEPLPKNETGKILKSQTKQRLLETGSTSDA